MEWSRRVNLLSKPRIVTAAATKSVGGNQRKWLKIATVIHARILSTDSVNHLSIGKRWRVFNVISIRTHTIFQFPPEALLFRYSFYFWTHLSLVTWTESTLCHYGKSGISRMRIIRNLSTLPFSEKICTINSTTTAHGINFSAA